MQNVQEETKDGQMKKRNYFTRQFFFNHSNYPDLYECV